MVHILYDSLAKIRVLGNKSPMRYIHRPQHVSFFVTLPISCYSTTFHDRLKIETALRSYVHPHIHQALGSSLCCQPPMRALITFHFSSFPNRYPTFSRSMLQQSCPKITVRPKITIRLITSSYSQQTQWCYQYPMLHLHPYYSACDNHRELHFYIY